MKKKNDPRHEKRVETMKVLFKIAFNKNSAYSTETDAHKIIAKKKEIDTLIKKNAPAWPIEQIAPVDLATLRLAVWELLFRRKKEPYKVIIDEAVEIAKEYGNQSSPSFINGVLGSIVSEYQNKIKSKS